MNNLTITPEEFKLEMERISKDSSDYRDAESRHSEADSLMCDLLRDLGYGEGADIFEEMEKWYA